MISWSLHCTKLPNILSTHHLYLCAPMMKFNRIMTNGLLSVRQKSVPATTKSFNPKSDQTH